VERSLVNSERTGFASFFPLLVDSGVRPVFRAAVDLVEVGPFTPAMTLGSAATVAFWLSEQVGLDH
jgi:hypothetical protein